MSPTGRLGDLRRARNPDGFDPVTAPVQLRSPYAGGGGQSAADVSRFDHRLIAIGTDTGGVRISSDGLATSTIHTLGFNKLRSRQTNGLRWSRTTPGRLFMICGDGEVGQGGVYVTTGANVPAQASPWKRLDGVVSGAPNLTFDGGNSPADGTAPTGPYPRQYGRLLEIDEVSLPGYTLLHVGTNSDGAWRIKVDNATLTAVEQVRYSGTAGKYVRCLLMATYEPNYTGNAYGRIIISLFSQSVPTQPVLCTNANVGTASPVLATTAIPGAPPNTHAMGHINNPAAGSFPLTVFAGSGTVRFSPNAFTAAAGSITMVEVTRTALQNDGPENDELWISVGTTHDGPTNYVLVGTFGGRRVSSTTYNTVWRGAVPASSSTPWGVVAWAPIGGPLRWSEQILNRPGAGNVWWLSGSNTPGRNGTAAVSAITPAPSQPGRMYVTARGNTCISDNFGGNWYGSRIWGSADHSSFAWDQRVNRSNSLTTTGDWALAGTVDGFATEPHAILKVGNANACWFDPQTGEGMVGGSSSGGHSVPATDDGNTVWGITPLKMAGTYDVIADAVNDYNLNTGSGANTAVGGVMCGANAYGPAGTQRAIIVGTMAGLGLWYTKNNGTTWLRLDAVSGTTHPFRTSSNHQNGVMVNDVIRSLVYAMDRGTGSVWRVSIATDGTVSSATCVFRNPWTYVSASDGCGYIDLDEANDRLWIATAGGVWFIPSASTAANVTGTSNATATGFVANYPGEIPGPMCFVPATGGVVVATMHFTSSMGQTYPLNGSEGPRFLVVTNPVVAGSWVAPDDWAITRDRSYRLGYTAPHGLGRNHDGSRICLTMQGNGVGEWKS